MDYEQINNKRISKKFALYIISAINGLVVGGCHFQTFWVGSKPVGSNFLHIFGVRKKKKKKNFQEKSVFFGEKSVFIGKNRFLSEKNRFYRKKSVLSEKIGFIGKNRRFFADFFFSDFSTAKSFPSPPISDFSPKNRPISAKFCSLVTSNKKSINLY